MTTKNDITGDTIKTKVNSDRYRSNWDNIFNKKPVETPIKDETNEKTTSTEDK